MKNLDLTLNTNLFDKMMESNSLSAEDKLVEVIKFEIKSNLKTTIRELYEKLTECPVYRGNSTFGNFAAHISDLEKYYVIQIIEEMCKNDKYFNDVIKINHSDIKWSENEYYNEQIKKEILG